MSAITRSGGSTPSVVWKRCSGKSASSLPRMKRSPPHRRIVAMPEPAVSTVDGSYQHGLVHVVVSAYQRGRDRPIAAERQRLKALRRLAAYEPSHRGLDVTALRSALDRAEPDPRQYLVDRRAQPPVPVEEEGQPEADQHSAWGALDDGVVV